MFEDQDLDQDLFHFMASGLNDTMVMMWVQLFYGTSLTRPIDQLRAIVVWKVHLRDEAPFRMLKYDKQSLPWLIAWAIFIICACFYDKARKYILITAINVALVKTYGPNQDIRVVLIKPPEATIYYGTFFSWTRISWI